jgi:hypothetical protein
LEKDFVVILTFVTILPMIEIPFCINPSIKRMLCLLCPQFELFLSMPLNYQNQIRMVSYKSIMCKNVNNFIWEIWHQQQQPKKLYILQTCASIWVLQLWGLKRGIKVFHIWTFCLFNKMSKGNLTYSCHIPTYALHHFINDKNNMVCMYKQVLHQQCDLYTLQS